MSYLIVKLPHFCLWQAISLALDKDTRTVFSSIETMVGTESASRTYRKIRVLLPPPGNETKTLTAGECQQSVSLTSKSKPEIPEALPRISVRHPVRIKTWRAVSSSAKEAPSTIVPPMSQERAFLSKQESLDKRPPQDHQRQLLCGLTVAHRPR